MSKYFRSLCRSSTVLLFTFVQLFKRKEVLFASKLTLPYGGPVGLLLSVSAIFCKDFREKLKALPSCLNVSEKNKQKQKQWCSLEPVEHL